MQTIAQQLGIKKFPFEIKDDNGNRIYDEASDGFWVKSKYDEKGNRIYLETSDGYWHKQEFDEKGNRIYYENSKGKVIDKRPKCENKVVAQQTVVDYLVNLYYTQYNVLLPSEDYEQANQMHKEQIIHAWREGENDPLRSLEFINLKDLYEKLDKQAEQYYNEQYGQGSPYTSSPNTQNK